MAKLEINFFTTPRRWKPPKNEPRLVTRSVQHGDILPAGLTDATKAGCCSSKALGHGKRACTEPPKPGQVELVFLPRKHGGGPALRFCTQKGSGALLHVKDPREAKKIAQKFQACVAGKRAKVKGCLPAGARAA